MGFKTNYTNKDKVYGMWVMTKRQEDYARELIDLVGEDNAFDGGVDIGW